MIFSFPFLDEKSLTLRGTIEKHIFYDISESYIYGLAQNEKILSSIIFAIVDASKPKAPLNAAFANYPRINLHLIAMNLGKGIQTNNVYFMNLQEAANVFENFATKYRNMTLGEEQHRVDKLRSETIFKVAVAFEKVVLSYGKYHLSGTRSSKRIVRDNICEHFHGCRFRFVTIDRLFSSCLTN